MLKNSRGFDKINKDKQNTQRNIFDHTVILITLPAVGLCHNPFANASFPVYLNIKALKGLIVFSEMQSSSTDKQGPDKELMTHNDAAEQILILARIRTELYDPEQTKAQLLQAGFGEDNLDLRSCDTKRKYRIVINSILDDDFRKNLLAVSESLVSKPEKRTRAQQVAEMAMDAKIKLELNSQQSDSFDLTDDIEQTPNSESSSLQTQSAQWKKFEKETIKTMQGQIMEDLGVNMSKWKYFSYTDRQGINQKPLRPRPCAPRHMP
ncbi:MAG: hypothetical protein EZS28_042313 [Streblomastix strix]|uniref:Uncharacterized protein n=1 Tax=Streblomastix strix TaxID=222440 RepID=A0A5J4TX12_9EUKA|nr:MAG: hypothetical protein EZS28_042313 [Streblomastix strix]